MDAPYLCVASSCFPKYFDCICFIILLWINLADAYTLNRLFGIWHIFAVSLKNVLVRDESYYLDDASHRNYINKLFYDLQAIL